MKLKFILLIICLTILGCAKKEEKKQNFLFISIDDLRPTLQTYGYPNQEMITPNMDKLAIDGIQFNNAFTNIAVCGASRASIMTGIRPSEKRFNDFSTRASSDTPKAIPLNQIFLENGYETISYGKIYHHQDDFEEFWTDKDKGADQMDFQDPKSIELMENAEMGEYGKKAPAVEYPEVSDYAYNDGEITLKAISKLKELKSSETPFFLAVGYVSPHLPFIQPKKYWDMYDSDNIKIAENTYQPINSPDIAIEAQHNSAYLRKNYLGIPAQGVLDENLSKELIQGYYASVSYMDAMIGELINALDELELRENTTIVLWSDHGYFLGEHGFWEKHSTFYEGVQIPLIISAPGYEKNKKANSFTELVDIYPTLCELAGITPPEYIHGESLVPVLKNSTYMLKDEIYTRYKQGETIIDDNFSYTEFWERGNILGNMLYDMKSDKGQNIDISNEVESKELIEKYSQKLKAMRDFVNKDPFIKIINNDQSE